MGRAKRSNCRLCSKPSNRSETTTINNLPKTFAHILEEISGLKFTEADGLHMSVCLRCHDFLQAMEHHSQYPKSNKISGSGKKKVRRLMDQGFSAAEAIDKVIAEKRARDLIAGATLPIQGAPVGVANAPRIVQNATGAIVPTDNRIRMSGAQRKKVQILIAGGVDRTQARELVLAASRASAGGNQRQLMGPPQRASVQRGVAQRGIAPRGVVQRAGVLQRGLAQKTPGPRAIIQKGVVRKVPAVRAPVQKSAPRNGPAQKAAPLRGNAQTGSGQRAPVQKVAPQKAAIGPAQRAPNQRKTQNAAAVNPQQQNRQNNPSAGKAQSARRNERPAPYNNRGGGGGSNNQNRLQNGDFNQQSCSLEVGIIPINFPNVQLDDMKLDALKEAITNEIFKIPQGGPLIRFLGTSSQNGWLKVICADDLSHDWLANLVARWERAGVRMVEGNSLPQPVVLSFYLPGDFRSPNEILNILEKQNNSLNTNQWRLINSENDPNGQSITVCVDEQSFQALQSRDFMVFLGLGVVELKPRRFPSDGGSISFNVPMQNARGNKGNNNRSNFNGNNSQGYSNGGGGGGMGNNYSNRSQNSGGGGGSYQRQGISQGQNYQRAGYQSQRSW